MPTVLLAGQATPQDLFAVDVGAPVGMLDDLLPPARCRKFGTPSNAVACQGGLGEVGKLGVDSTTFWIVDGQVSRIYAPARLPSHTYEQCVLAFRARVGRMTALLASPATETTIEPSGFAAMDDDMRLYHLGQGRLRFQATWRLGYRQVTVGLHGDKGVPVLVVGLEAAPGAPSCSGQKVAAMLMDLFPPASPTARAAAAQGLAACKVAGAAGALAAAAGASSETEVRIEAVRALGAIGDTGKPALEAIARKSRDDDAVRMARQLLEKPQPSLGTDRAPAVVVAPPRPASVEGVASAPLPADSATASGPARLAANNPTAPETVPQPEVRPALAPPSATPSAAEPAEPEKPKGPPDGTALALTTSLVAGGIWGGGLSLLAQQNSAGVVLLVGGAGAVIGGGTAWGLTHFGLRPSPAQALWFTNSTAWGTLAGLAAWAGSGSDNVKLKWGLLVGGESLGMGMGVLGARVWNWTPSQILFANGLLLGAGLGGAGGGLLAHPTTPFHISPLAGYGAAPVMVASAIASRYIDVSGNDVHLMSASALAAGWSAGLLAYGLDSDSSTRGNRLGGGLLAGMGAGYLGAAALSPFVELSPRRVWVSGAGLLAGNLIGLGSTMMVAPDDTVHRPLWASVSGVAFGLGTFLAYPHLRLGEQFAPMAAAGAAYGAGTWALAMAVSRDGSVPRLQGGMLALGTAGALTGLVASSVFAPTGEGYAVTLSSAALGATAGIGVAKLATPATGTGELAGSLVGSAAGFAAGAAFAHHAELRAPDLGAAVLGGGYGALVGALVPSLADAEWGGWQRKNQGGLLLGLPVGVAASVALSRGTGASGATVTTATVGAVLGLGMGLGTGLLRPDGYSQPSRIGAVAGVSAGLLGALGLEHPLHLDEGLGGSALGLAALGTGLGLSEGILLAGLVDPSGYPSGASSRQLWGGGLLGGSAGLASGLLFSKLATPGPLELGVTAGGALLGGFFGRGLAMSVTDTAGRGDTAATMAGVLGGSAALALVENYAPLRDVDLAAAGTGLAFGGVVGALAPTLADPEWGGWRRKTDGGLLLGLGGGALAGAALWHLGGAESATLAVGSAGGLLGLGIGVGTGLLWPEGYSQPARIGAVAGLSGGIAGALLLAQPLRLSEGLGESAGGLAAVGTGLGIAEGILVAGLVDPSGEVSRTSSRQLAGGALLGGSAGLASGLLLSKLITPSPGDLAATVGGAVGGALFGRGLAMTALASDGRRDTAATAAGAVLGTAGVALTQHISPLDATDAAAAGAGLAYGGLVGALVPTLADATWGGWRRSTEGGLTLGLSSGAFGAAALAHVSGTTPRTLGLGLAGAFDGGLTGAGIGLLADGDRESTQGARIGVVAGATAGLALGLGLWPRIDFRPDNLIFVSAVSAVGGWTGGWAQLLGHASVDDVEARKVEGGIMAGAGAASIVATALLPALHVDTDLIGDALAADLIFSGAGAGVGALSSRRADAPVWGMLGAGTAGLLLGGSLHSSIDFERSSGLLTFAGLEGLWAGAWLPYVLRPRAEVTTRDNLAGLAAGGLGGLGLSVLASTVGTPSAQGMGMAAIGSGIGASIAGGSVLVADDLHDQRGVGIMLGGTAAGLGLGALVSTVAPLDQRRAWHMLGGAGFGLAEGLAFAWAGRAASESELVGSALVGTGLGASLGLASSADAIGLDTQQGLVATGFSAWGGWVGSFAGALAKADPHEVVLGGLAAANVSFLAGYAALRYDWVEPRDFGWLSLGGALGAALGGGVGAALSTGSNPAPVLAGLSAGPVVGIGASAFILPHLRHRGSTTSTALAPTRVAGLHLDLAPDSGSERPRTSADVLAERKTSRFLAGLKLAQRHLFDVTRWTPIFGSLPPVPGDPNPAPFFMGVSGELR